MHVPKLVLPIETSRLTIRSLRPSDSDARFELHSDPAYIKFIGQPIDRERSDALLANELNGDAELFSAAVSLHEGDEMIGECILLPSTVAEVELVIALLPAFRGEGYGPELAQAAIDAALADPGVTTVIACVEDENEAAVKLVNQLGFLRDGIMPRASGKMPRRYVRTNEPGA